MPSDDKYQFRFDINYNENVKTKYLLLDWIVNSVIITSFIIIILIAIHRKYIIGKQIESNKTSKINYKRLESRLKNIEKFTLNRIKHSIKRLKPRKLKRSLSDFKVTSSKMQGLAQIVLDKDSYVEELYTQPINIILNQQLTPDQRVKSKSIINSTKIKQCYSNDIGNKSLNNRSKIVIIPMENRKSKAIYEKENSVGENATIDSLPTSNLNTGKNCENDKQETLNSMSLNSTYKENEPYNIGTTGSKINFDRPNVPFREDYINILEENDYIEESAYTDSVKDFDGNELQAMKKAFQIFYAIPHPSEKLNDQSVNCTQQE